MKAKLAGWVFKVSLVFLEALDPWESRVHLVLRVQLALLVFVEHKENKVHKVCVVLLVPLALLAQLVFVGRLALKVSKASKAQLVSRGILVPRV